MAIAKRCFICAHKENEDKSCTNPNCPRYKIPATNTAPTAPATPAADTTSK